MAHPQQAARAEGARARTQDNALVIDLEFWHSPEFVRGHVPEPNDDQLSKSTKTGNVLSAIESQGFRK
jgi:hypothetical protein